MKDKLKEFEGCPPVLSKKKKEKNISGIQVPLLFQGSVKAKKVNKQMV